MATNSKTTKTLTQEALAAEQSFQSYNRVTLVGRLTRDPVTRTLADGRTVCDLRLAVGARGDSPLFVDVATFGKPAEACARHLSKGREVAVTGSLVYREWTAKDGSKRSKHSVVGRVQFGSRPNAPVSPAASDEVVR